MNAGNDQVRRRNVDLVRHAEAAVEVLETTVNHREPLHDLVPAQRAGSLSWLSVMASIR
ncbi:hypothetical protein ACXC9Q_22600 [Kribbella sp. CWNU-51]